MGSQSHAWEKWEEEALLQHWGKLTSQKIAETLGTVSDQQVKNKIKHLRAKGKLPNCRIISQAHNWEPWEEEAVRKQFDKLPPHKIAQEIGTVSARQVRDKIKHLREKGLLPPDKTWRWSQEEVDRLEELAETMPLKFLAKRWEAIARKNKWRKRSPQSLASKLRSLGYSAEPQVDFFRLTAIAAALGISYHTAHSWVRQGNLKPATPKNANPIYIKAEELVQFACTHSDIAHLASRDGMQWLLQLVEEVLSRYRHATARPAECKP